ncbi:hypothetical protein ANCDUO_12726 [Ancylostoma duodenale]|uniref:Serpin domain-containing protein n=1 Tax=Ancylostoma duodenale TaxID=51022 RepID=A0A0C2GDU7_9BILA|nr:hypothetical protein ANCDUO_12726 [Ancylostoma duodenale]
MVKSNNVKGAFALIVNAIYFTGEWSVKFDQGGNSKRKFFSAENSEKLEFMNKVDHRLYAEDADLQVLSLQYKDTSYAFNILLPKKRYTRASLRRRKTVLSEICDNSWYLSDSALENCWER